jgi:hypothetical protein
MSSRLASVCFCIALLSAFAIGISAEGFDGNGQRVRSLDDPVVADIEDLLVESGSLFLSYAAPYSDAELRGALDRIHPDGLSAAGRAKYDAVLAALHPDPHLRSGKLGAKAGLKVDLDANWRSNEAAPWVLDYQERPSFLALSLEGWAGDTVYGYFGPSIKRDYWAVQAKLADLSPPNITSLPIDFVDTDGNFPFRSFAAAGGDFWSLRLGRDKLSLGSMGEDNLVVSSRAEWYDYARLELNFRSFEYSAYAIQLQPQRYLYMHRADFLLWDKLSVGLTEGTLVGNAPLELRFLNPMMIFHGYEAWNDDSILASSVTSGGKPLAPAGPTDTVSGVGSMLGVELNYAPLRSLNLVAQYQFNAGRDPIKLLLWPSLVSDLPNSASYLLGAKLRSPLRGGYLRGELLGVYSEPFDMILANDRISYIYRRASNSNAPGALATVEEWIGFPEGPDCIFVSGSLGYETASRASATLSASYRWKGANDLGTAYPSTSNSIGAGLLTPSGIVEGRFRVGADFAIPLWTIWKAKAAVYYTHRVNAADATGVNVQGAVDQGVELMVGLGLSL